MTLQEKILYLIFSIVMNYIFRKLKNMKSDKNDPLTQYVDFKLKIAIYVSYFAIFIGVIMIMFNPLGVIKIFDF